MRRASFEDGLELHLPHFRCLGDCYSFWDRAEQMVQHKITALKWEEASIPLSLVIIFPVCCCMSASLFRPRCCEGETSRYMEAEGSRENLQLTSLHRRGLNMHQLLSHAKMFLLTKAENSLNLFRAKNLKLSYNCLQYTQYQIMTLPWGLLTIHSLNTIKLNSQIP